jgi:hypothetical protein
VGGKRIVTGARNTVTGNSPSMAHQSVTVTEIVASEVMTAAAHGVASKSMSSVSAQPMTAQPMTAQPMTAQPMTKVGCAAVGGKPMKPTAPAVKPSKPTATAVKATASTAPAVKATASTATTATPCDCRSVGDDAKRANRNARCQNTYCFLLHGAFLSLFNYFLRRRFPDVAAHYFSVIVALQQGPPGPKAAKCLRQWKNRWCLCFA